MTTSRFGSSSFLYLAASSGLTVELEVEQDAAVSLIFGSINRDGRPQLPEAFRQETLPLAYWGPDSRSYWIRGAAALGKFALHSVEEGAEANAIATWICPLGYAVVAAADARLDNRAELFRELGRGEAGNLESDSSLILRSYLRWGGDFAKRLLGDFAIAIWDERAGKLLLARDHVGAKPLYYSCSRELVAFGSEPAALVNLLPFEGELDREWIVMSLFGPHFAEIQGRTHWKGVALLKSATVFEVDSKLQRSHRYWRLDPSKTTSLRGPDDYAARFRELLQDSVNCRLRGASSIGLEMSGGLDSASIALLAKSGSNGKRFAAFNHASWAGARGEVWGRDDESEQARRYCEWLGIGRPDRIEGPEEGMGQLFRDAERQRLGPAFDGWSSCSRPLYRRAGEVGCGVLLSGAGGDALATASLGAAYRHELLAGNWSWIWGELKKESVKLGLGEANAALRFAKLIGSRFGDLRFWRKADPELFISSALARRYRVLGQFAEQQAREEAMSIRERQAWRVGDHYLTHVRLPESSFSARAYKLDIRHPMLDVRLLEFCLSAPLEQQRRDGYGRSLLRRSMIELPDWIRRREVKSVPAIPWASERIVADLGELSKAPSDSRILDVEALRQSVERARSGVPLRGLALAGCLRATSLLASPLSGWNA